MPDDLLVFDCERDAPCPPRRMGQRTKVACQRLHSYPPSVGDHLVQRWCWRPDGPVVRRAIDVEDASAAPPPELLAAHRGDPSDFWLDWTNLEVIAKLTHTPVLLLVRQGALGAATSALDDPAAIVMEHFRIGTIVCCRGRFEPKERA